MLSNTVENLINLITGKDFIVKNLITLNKAEFILWLVITIYKAGSDNEWTTKELR